MPTRPTITIGTLMRKTEPQSLPVSQWSTRVLQQQAAEHRAQGDGATDRGGPQADGPAALVRREDDGDDRQGDRQDRGTADAHDRRGRR